MPDPSATPVPRLPTTVQSPRFTTSFANKRFAAGDRRSMPSPTPAPQEAEHPTRFAHPPSMAEAAQANLPPPPISSDVCIVPTIDSRADRVFACKMLLNEARRYQLAMLEQKKLLFSSPSCSFSAAGTYMLRPRGYSLISAAVHRTVLNDIDLLMEECTRNCPDGNYGHTKGEISRLRLWWF